MSNSRGLSEGDLTGIMDILRPQSFKWKAIGQGLGFASFELSAIEANPLLFAGAPDSYLSALLGDWMKWGPGDSRGSKDYATLQSLGTAVRKAEPGVAAEQTHSTTLPTVQTSAQLSSLKLQPSLSQGSRVCAWYSRSTTEIILVRNPKLVCLFRVFLHTVFPRIVAGASISK